EMGSRKFTPPKNELLTVNQILNELVVDYKLRDKYSPQVQSHLKPIRTEVGDRPAARVTETQIRHYIQKMLNLGKAKATVNRGTQLLGQAYRLMRKRVGEGPEILRLSEKDNVRRGFVDPIVFE